MNSSSAEQAALILQQPGCTVYLVGAAGCGMSGLGPHVQPHARFSARGSESTVDSKPFFVIEADESDGSLREFHSEHAIVLNVDEEHLDYFANLDAVCREFQQFASQTSRCLVYCADDPRLVQLFSQHAGAISYGYHPLAGYRIIAKTKAPS